MSFSVKGLFTGLLVFAAIFIFSNVHAAYLTNVPQRITQPDGMVIDCFATGDEFYNWLHDEKGFTIVQSQEDGFYYYAVLDRGSLVPSPYKTGTDDPSAAGLRPWINIPFEEMESIRSDFIDRFMPARQPLQGFRDPIKAPEFSKINNLVVYIRFSDQGEFARDTMHFYHMFNNTSQGYNSMQNYFWEISYETLEMPSWFYPIPDGPNVISYQDIHPRSYYLPYNASTNPNGYRENQRASREHALLKRACEYIENEVPLNIDLDNNGDGYVDNMIFNVRGAPSAWSTLLWPHRWVLYNETATIHGKRVWDYNFQIETELDSRGNGVLCHETYHTLGAPDLYHYGQSSITSVGRWDVMDQNMNPPQSMGAYMKYRYGGWIDEIPEITECGVYTLNPITSPENNCFKIASPNSTLEYFVLEYRRKRGTFEGSAPGTGLLVYRIDKRYDGDGNAGGPPDEVYLYRQGGTPTSNGSLSEANLSANEGRTEINNNSDPFAFLQNGQPAGLDISNVGYVGETISFEVSFNKAPVAGFASSGTLITEGCSLDFFDNSFCNTDSWEWTFEGGTPSTSNEQHPEGIVFNESGSYAVTLKVTNQYGSNSITMNDYVTVSNTAAPEVRFSVSDSVVCSREVVQLTDESDVCPESWLWEISPQNGVAFLEGSDANSRYPEIVLNEQGNYTVKLTVTNANGSSSLVKEKLLTVGGYDAPFVEDFEHNAIRQNAWTVVNDDNFITWDDFAVSGNGGFGAAGIDNYDYFSFLERDQLISPPIDLSGLQTAELRFDHAYALSGDILDYSDTLVVKISGDCGESWKRLLSVVEDGTGNFVTREPTIARFIPGSKEDWCGAGYGSNCNRIDITPWAGMDNVMIMFESVRILGNNIYIDNIEVGQYLDIAENDTGLDEQLEIYPNPGNGLYELSVQHEGTLRIYNIQGQLVLENEVNISTQPQVIDLSGNPSGLYFVRIDGEGLSSSGKLINR